MRHLNGPALNKNTAQSDRFWYNELPIQYDPDYVALFDDFVRIGNDETNSWTVVEDAGASVAIETDTPGGWLNLVSTATTDNDGASIQGNEIFALESGRYIWGEARVKWHDADDCDFFFGLTENWATNPEGVFTVGERVGFEVLEGSASVLCIAEDGGNLTTVDSQIDAVDDTAMILGFRCIGTGAIEYYVNRIKVATITTNISTNNLALALAHISGSATGTFILHCDYLGCWMTR